MFLNDRLLPYSIVRHCPCGLRFLAEPGQRLCCFCRADPAELMADRSQPSYFTREKQREYARASYRRKVGIAGARPKRKAGRKRHDADPDR